MSCQACAGTLARNEQLENELEHARRFEKRLLEQAQKDDNTIKGLERRLREAKDELRLRRTVTGYLPHLDTPEVG